MPSLDSRVPHHKLRCIPVENRNARRFILWAANNRAGGSRTPPLGLGNAPAVISRALRCGGRDHRQDASLERLGQGGPCIHDGGQVGVRAWGKLGGSQGTFLDVIIRFKTR